MDFNKHDNVKWDCKYGSNLPNKGMITGFSKSGKKATVTGSLAMIPLISLSHDDNHSTGVDR